MIQTYRSSVRKKHNVTLLQRVVRSFSSFYFGAYSRQPVLYLQYMAVICLKVRQEIAVSVRFPFFPENEHVSLAARAIEIKRFSLFSVNPTGRPRDAKTGTGWEEFSRDFFRSFVNFHLGKTNYPRRSAAADRLGKF